MTLGTERYKKQALAPTGDTVEPGGGPAPGAPPTGDTARAHDLAIEKKWVELARIDADKFLYFYDKYYERISRFIYRKTFNLDLTEELTSRTFFRAIERRWQFHWRGISFGAWLYRIALNEVRLDRKRKKTWSQESLQSEGGPACPRRNQLSQMIDTEDQLRVRECLQQLDEVSQNIVILHYWEGMSLQEIQAVVGKPIGTIKSKLKRARDAIKKMLDEDRRRQVRRYRAALLFRIIPGGRR